MRHRLSLPIPATHVERHPPISLVKTQLEKEGRRTSVENGSLPDLGYIRAEVANWLMAAEIGQTYRQVFPKQWHRSHGATAITHGMSVRELEMFDQAAKRFPCVQLFNYWWGGNERPPGFLVRISNYGPTPPEQWDEADLVGLVFECLCDYDIGYSHERAAFVEVHLAMPLPQLPDGAVFSLARFRKACNARRSRRWRDLCDAIAVSGCCAGNPFLEPPPNEEPVGRFMNEIGISPKALHQLEQDWHEAQRLLRALTRASAWLKREPRHWPAIFAIWQSCLIAKRTTQDG